MNRRSPVRSTLGSRKDDEPARDWLDRILAAIDDDPDIDDVLLGEVLRRVNGSLGDEQQHIEEDPDAYLAFWATLADRLPTHPYARAGYADTLLLTGNPDGARREMLAAFEQDPTLVYRMSGEYADVMRRGGRQDDAAYRALAIRAAEISGPDVHADYIADELRSLMADIADDPALQRLVLRLLRRRPP